MTTVIADPVVARNLINERRRNGLDRWDEVWEGVYQVMPSPNNEHQDIQDGLIVILRPLIHDASLGIVQSTVNVSDRTVNWEDNYRIPDVAVFLSQSSAENCETFWHGGPDLGIEIISPNDRSREKIDFYESIGTRELLLIDRDPWQLHLFRLTDGALQLVGTSSLEAPSVLESQVLPLTWSVIAGEPRPQIVIDHATTRKQWTV